VAAKLKKFSRRGLVLISVGAVAVSVGAGNAGASTTDEAHSLVNHASFGFWDGP
jgi:hypothetical protein